MYNGQHGEGWVEWGLLGRQPFQEARANQHGSAPSLYPLPSWLWREQHILAPKVPYGTYVWNELPLGWPFHLPFSHHISHTFLGENCYWFLSFILSYFFSFPFVHTAFPSSFLCCCFHGYRTSLCAFCACGPVWDAQHLKGKNGCLSYKIRFSLICQRTHPEKICRSPELICNSSVNISTFYCKIEARQ